MDPGRGGGNSGGKGVQPDTKKKAAEGKVGLKGLGAWWTVTGNSQTHPRPEKSSDNKKKKWKGDAVQGEKELLRTGHKARRKRRTFGKWGGKGVGVLQRASKGGVEKKVVDSMHGERGVTEKGGNR